MYKHNRSRQTINQIITGHSFMEKNIMFLLLQLNKCYYFCRCDSSNVAGVSHTESVAVPVGLTLKLLKLWNIFRISNENQRVMSI